MPRKPRFILPGQPHHVIIRGIDREPIFYHDTDYRYYLRRLAEAIEKHCCALHAYVLMTNHVHLLLTPTNEYGISKTIQMMGRYYVQYFNKKYSRTGTLWEGRYKSTLVDTDRYLLLCYRYIELNPVRANMISDPTEYHWSSFRHNALGQGNALITSHEVYEMLGETDLEQQQAYLGLFDTQISKQQLNEIRFASNREWLLGSDNFKQKIEQKLNRRIRPLPRGGDRKSKHY